MSSSSTTTNMCVPDENKNDNGNTANGTNASESKVASSTKPKKKLEPNPFRESALYRKDQLQRVERVFQAAAASKGLCLLRGGSVLRPLKSSEIRTLQNKCQSSDWSKLRLWLSDATESKRDQSRALDLLVSNNTKFEGFVVFGIHGREQEQHHDSGLPPGIHGNTIISNCVFEPGCRIYNNTVLSNTYVAKNAEISNCGRIFVGGKVVYGDLSITVGPESGGGRELAVQAEQTMLEICQLLKDPKTPLSFGAMENAISHWNFIGNDCVVRDTPNIKSVFCMGHSRIEGAAAVESAVMLPNSKIGNASTASNVILQWNASIIDSSSVTNTFLMEHAHAGPHSIVAESVLGPDVHVSAGEVYASVIGPNTNAHHQSLVISVLWPLGRGNVAYGANVGSNHTGRLPDQETVASEGTFWGLSSIIKFPVDLSFSPYSIVAAGTTLVPQRITMPFSLMVEQERVCQIIPGWVLHHSPFTLTRSEAKYANRRKALRHKFYTGWKIARPDIVDMCWAARDLLNGLVDDESKAEYKSVPGIGKLTMSEKARTTGVVAYNECIQLYALRGFLDWLLHSNKTAWSLVGLVQDEFAESKDKKYTPSLDLSEVNWAPNPWDRPTHTVWEHQRSILMVEFPWPEDDTIAWIKSLLFKLVHMEKGYADRVLDCKKRDDKRGAATIPGYAISHLSAEDDAVVKAMQGKAVEVEKIVTSIVDQLPEQGALSSKL